MSKTYYLKSEAERIHLIQITDPHLFNQPEGELLGINTLASFKQVLKEIKEQDFHYELVLATGDLVQDGTEEGYLTFCKLIPQLNKPVFWVPGNHDFQPKMYERLAKATPHIQPMKHIVLGKYWQLILLDSQLSGAAHGNLTQQQLEWLNQTLSEHQDRFTLLVLHHHIIPTNSAWLDQHNLRNATELLEIIQNFSFVKGILHGHIHQQVDDIWQGYKIMATPSTCIQFSANSHNFCLDTIQPGWREIELASDGEIYTRVKRIQHAQFIPNLQEEGY